MPRTNQMARAGTVVARAPQAPERIEESRVRPVAVRLSFAVPYPLGSVVRIKDTV